MATFSRGDVVKVPFPYSDRATRQFRPALVVSEGLHDAHGLEAADATPLGHIATAPLRRVMERVARELGLPG
jgi:hypothetical protein